MLHTIFSFVGRVAGFSASGFLVGHLPPGPWVCRWGRLGLFRGFAGIFAARGVPQMSAALVADSLPVSAAPGGCLPSVLVALASNFAADAVGVVDAGGGFAAGVGDAGGGFATGVGGTGGGLPLGLAPPMSAALLENNRNNIRLQTS